jgi:hypothetical protein
MSKGYGSIGRAQQVQGYEFKFQFCQKKKKGPKIICTIQIIT